MQALLLTAGLGTRLDPISRLVAKPAVPLGDRSIIEHVISWLRQQNVTDLVLNLHHRPASIAAVVGDGRHLGVRARYSWEQPVLGSAGGPRHALPLFDADSFLIVNGDTLCDMSLAPMIEAHYSSGADVTMAVVPNLAPDRYNGIAADGEARVQGFVPRGRAMGTWHFVGVQMVRPHVFAGLEDGRVAETVAGIYPALIAARPGSIRLWPTQATFLDVGTPRDYLAAGLLRGPDQGPAGVTRSLLWPRTTVGARVVLDECIVAGGVSLPDDFAARSAVIVPASVARKGDPAEIRGTIAIFPLE
jgi:mannose-1-phosphate guanylyltransferase